jgi:hypothetical protein
MSPTVHRPQCRIRITLHQAMSCKFRLNFIPGPRRLSQTVEGMVQAYHTARISQAFPPMWRADVHLFFEVSI